MPLKNIQTKFDIILSERNNLFEEKNNLGKNLTKANQDVLTQQKAELENRINQEENYLNTLALDGAARQETINSQHYKIWQIKRNLEEIGELLSKVGQEDLQGQLEIYISNKIAILKERTEMWEEITKKNNRLFQLEKLFKGGATILEKQYNHVIQLKKQLEQEKKDKGISQEQSNHLKEDIKRLDKEKKELDQRIKELENLDEESKKLRDQELADLRQQRDARPNITQPGWQGFYDWLIKEFRTNFAEKKEEYGLTWFGESTNRKYNLSALLRSLKKVLNIPFDDEETELEESTAMNYKTAFSIVPYDNESDGKDLITGGSSEMNRDLNKLVEEYRKFWFNTSLSCLPTPLKKEWDKQGKDLQKWTSNFKIKLLNKFKRKLMILLRKGIADQPNNN